MRVLDIDLDYFMRSIANTDFSVESRLSEDDYGESVWDEWEVIHFIENNLGLSKQKRIPGKIISGHDESLYFWEELMQENKLSTPFEVVHVDSHGDLGVGQLSHIFLQEGFLTFPVEARRRIRTIDAYNGINIGDYLLWAIGYQMVSHIIHCANPYNDIPYCIDANETILKDFTQGFGRGNESYWNTIQLKYNPHMELRSFEDDFKKEEYLRGCTIKDPEVPILTIPTIEGVKFCGDFDYITVAQSPNYTPASADYILNVFREYIDEI